MFRQADTPVVRFLKKDLANGNTPLVCITGRQRSGKTAFALSIAHAIYGEKFTFDNLVNTVEDFAKRMNETENNIIILDEASVSLYVYDWNSYLHKIFTIITDSQAYKYNMTILVLPRIDKLGKLHKMDVDIIIKCMKIKVFNEETQKYEKQFFYKYKYHHKNYDSINVNKAYVSTIVEQCGPVPAPPEHLWTKYMEFQKTFKEKILSQQLEQIYNKKNPKQAEKPIF